MIGVAAAYRACEEITRSRARNFFYGIRLLPPPRRRALSVVYALARRIDDIGDGPAPVPVRLAGLSQVRAALARLAPIRLDAAATIARTGAGGTALDTGVTAAELSPEIRDDPVLVALADAARRYPIPLAAFGELVDGCEADVLGRHYPTFGGLVGYCRRVAGSVGRLSLGVMDGAEVPAPRPITDPDQLTDPTTADLADALGVALQITNILRDLVEDRRTGRIYLPAEDLARFGCRLDPLPAPGGFADPPDALAALVRFQADRAERWYAVGLRLLPRLDRRSAACTGAMAGIYHRLLRRIRRDPLSVTRARGSLPGWEKALVAARALARGAA